MEGVKSGGGSHRANFLLLLSSSFLFLMTTHLLVPMMPIYLKDIGALETEVGFIIGLVALTAVFTRIPVGRFIDRHGRRGQQPFHLLDVMMYLVPRVGDGAVAQYRGNLLDPGV